MTRMSLLKHLLKYLSLKLEKEVLLYAVSVAVGKVEGCCYVKNHRDKFYELLELVEAFLKRKVPISALRNYVRNQKEEDGDK